MPRIDRFLQRPVEEPALPEKKKKGRPWKDPTQKAKRSKDYSKLIPGTWRMRPEFIRKKEMAGRRNPSSKKKTAREKWKREYAKRASYHHAFRHTLKRRFQQHRSKAGLVAAKRGIKLEEFYQLDFATFLLIWETAPLVLCEERWVRAQDVLGTQWTGGTYLDRLDRSLPYTRENVRVFRHGKPL